MMTLTVADARTLTETARTEKSRAVEAWANHEITNTIEPAIQAAAENGLDYVRLRRDLFESYTNEVFEKIIEIINDAGYTVESNSIDFVIYWD